MAFLSRAADALWNPWLLGLFLLTGLVYSAGSGFFQIFGFPVWWRATAGTLGKRGPRTGGGLSPLQALATALACFMTARMPNKWLAPLPPVLCNAIIVGAEIAYSAVGGFGGAFWAAVGPIALSVGLGELAVCYILGLPLLALLPKVEAFRGLIPEKRISTL